MIRCLWLTRQFPLPPNSGELIYTSGLIEALSSQGAQLNLLCYDRNDNTDLSFSESIRAVKCGPIPPRGMRSILSMLPSDAQRLRSPAMVTELRRQLHGHAYDAVIIDQAAQAWALDEVLALETTRRPSIVYVSHNREAAVRKQIVTRHRGNLVKQLALRQDAWKYGKLEQRICQVADLITAITPADRQLYAAEYPGTPVIEMSPGYQQPVSSVAPQPINDTTPRRVVMVGSFEWVAKRYNLEEFLRVAAPVFERESIELQVVGKASRNYADRVREQFAAVNFECNVPSIEPYLSQTRMGLIAETVGGGFKLKTLDYAFHHVPIAALTDALGGVDLEPDKDALIEDSIPALVDKIVSHIDDFEFLNTAARRTYRKLNGRFDWADRGQDFYKALDASINARSSRPDLKPTVGTVN
jgi:hypothetical protein